MCRVSVARPATGPEPCTARFLLSSSNSSSFQLPHDPFSRPATVRSSVSYLFLGKTMPNRLPCSKRSKQGGRRNACPARARCPLCPATKIRRPTRIGSDVRQSPVVGRSSTRGSHGPEVPRRCGARCRNTHLGATRTASRLGVRGKRTWSAFERKASCVKRSPCSRRGAFVL